MAPSKSAHEGSAGPLKTAASKEESSSSRCSPTKVRVDGVRVEVDERLTAGLLAAMLAGCVFLPKMTQG